MEAVREGIKLAAKDASELDLSLPPSLFSASFNSIARNIADLIMIPSRSPISQGGMKNE